MNIQTKIRHTYDSTNDQNDIERHNNINFLTRSVLERKIRPSELHQRIVDFDQNPTSAKALTDCFANYARSSYDVNLGNKQSMLLSTGVHFSGRCSPSDPMSEYGKEIFQRIVDTIESKDITNKEECYKIIFDHILNKQILPFFDPTNNTNIISILEVDEITKQFFHLAYQYTKNEQYMIIFDKGTHDNYIKKIRPNMQNTQQRQNARNTEVSEGMFNLILFLGAALIVALAVLFGKLITKSIV